MRLLPGERIFVASTFKLTLYYTSVIQATTNIPPIGIPHWLWQPLNMWEYSMALGYPQNVSQLYRCRDTNTLRLVFNTDRAIHGCIVSCDSDINPKPKIIKLMDLNLRYRFSRVYSLLSLGYNSAIGSSDGAARIRMLYYSWPDDSGCPLGPSNSLIVKFGKRGWSEESPAFDEGSGRVVAESSGNEILVYDFSELKSVSS